MPNTLPETEISDFAHQLIQIEKTISELQASKSKVYKTAKRELGCGIASGLKSAVGLMRQDQSKRLEKLAAGDYAVRILKIIENSEIAKAARAANTNALTLAPMPTKTKSATLPPEPALPPAVTRLGSGQAIMDVNRPVLFASVTESKHHDGKEGEIIESRVIGELVSRSPVDQTDLGVEPIEKDRLEELLTNLEVDANVEIEEIIEDCDAPWEGPMVEDAA